MKLFTAVGAAAVLVGGLLAGCSSSSGGSGSSTSSSAPPPTSTSPGAGSGSMTGSAPASATGSAPASNSPSASGSSSSPVASGPSGGPVPAKFTPASATFIGADTGWVLGTAPCSDAPCTSVVRTRDGGRSWQGIPAPRASLGGPGGTADGAVTVLRFATASDGWAGVDKLYSTHDGGASWHAQKIAPSGSAVTAIQTGGGYVYAKVGCPTYGTSDCSASTRVYASPISSDRWVSVAGGLPGGAGVSGLVVHGATWYLPTETAIYRGTGTGAASHSVNPCPSEGGDGRATPVLAVADSSHLDALCLGDGAAGSASYQLYGTTNGGASWQKAGASRRGPSDANAIADNGAGVLLVSAASGASAVLRTTNDGTSFTTTLSNSSSGGREWADLGFTTSSQALVVLPRVAMYLSHDAGASFARVSF